MASPTHPLKTGPVAEEYSALAGRLRGELSGGLREFSARGRERGDAVAAALGIVLPELKRLRRLDCGDCGLTDHGVRALVRALEVNSSVQRLDLSGNGELTNYAGRDVLALLREGKNTSLTECDLSGTQMSDELVQQVSLQAEMNSFPQQLRSILPALEADGEVTEQTAKAGIGVAGGAAESVVLSYDCLDPQVYTVRALERLAAAAARSGQLRELRLERCFRLGCRAAEALRPVLAQSRSLTSFGLVGCGLGYTGTRAITTAVAENPHSVLTTIDVSDNEVGDAGAELLAEMLSASDTVTTVDLSLNNVSPPLRHRVAAGCALNVMPRALKESLPRLLRNDPTLSVLALAGGEGKGRCTARGYFDNLGATIVAEALEHNNVVVELDLSNNHIGPEGAGAIAEMLTQNATLHRVDLSGNAALLDEGARRLLNGMTKNDTLTSLSVAGCGCSRRIEEEVASVCLLNRQPRLMKQLLPRLRAGPHCDPSLSRVDLETHRDRRGVLLTHEGAALLQAALKGNDHVTDITLANNAIGDEGAQSVALCMKESRGLVTLNLANNGIGKDGALALLRALRHNHTVRSLELAGNKDIPLDLREEIETALKLNYQALEVKEIITRLGVNDSTLTNVDLTGLPQEQRITDDCLRLIVDVLICNTHVRTLNLEGNRVSNRGVEYLCEWVGDDGGGLTCLNLASNDVGTDGALMLRDAVSRCTQLRRLDLRDNHVLERGAAAILELVRGHPQLTEVDIALNQADPEVHRQVLDTAHLNTYPPVVKAAALAMLDDDPQAVEVDLTTSISPLAAGGPSGDALCRALEGPLRATRHLCRLRLDDCYIEDDGCRALSRGIRGHNSLERLSLRRNPFGSAGADALASAVEEDNDVLIELDVADCKHLTDGDLARIEAALELNAMPVELKHIVAPLRRNDESLTVVQLGRPVEDAAAGSRVVGDAGCVVLLGCMSANTRVHTLDLSNNRIGDAGAGRIAELLKVNTGLRRVVLDDNDIGVAGLQQLAAAVWHNQTLAELLADRNLFNVESDPIARGAWNHLDSKLTVNAETLAAPQPRGYEQRKAELAAAAVDLYRTNDYMRRVEEDIMRDALADAPARERREAEARKA
eukprot:TRINITY_DN65368_c0_g1_i1.p1 TRINITY_DN65368_c0_g1~~TRINITY_DN65368_c0_g1_i1.p1  ORF type:complete len:1137 (+),score=403.12 TRINITY_DN65368_c0_g1_i1:81-3413(+)